MIMFLLKISPKRKKKTKDSLFILVTGTFYSDHWLITHLRPMAGAENCHKLIMVSASKVPEIENVEGVYAPKLLQKLTGQVGSRLLYFCWLAIKSRPDVLVGFHLLLNGLFAALLAKMINSKSVYICGGGAREVAGGGIETENRIFSRIGQADLFIESQLIKIVNEIDLVIAMGKSTVDYFNNKGVDTWFEIIPGGFDNQVFKSDISQNKEFDLILVGRLSEVKRVDNFLHAIKIAKKELPNLNAVIVGDGPDMEALEELAFRLDIYKDVNFVGWQDDVHIWLQKSQCFVLTSDSEGLSQALIQAMMTGLPAITSDVGDLDNLLVDGDNGYLVLERSPENFAHNFVKLLGSNNVLNEFSQEALKSTEKFSVLQVKSHWTKVFDKFL